MTHPSMTPAEREAFAQVSAQFFRAGGVVTFTEWCALDADERAVLEAVKKEAATPRRFTGVDLETGEAYERVLAEMERSTRG